MKIAVIGAGVSGLTTAYLLHENHDVTVYEADDRIGGHSNTVVASGQNGTQPVDTGFIVYNDRNYPNFERLLERLGVRTEASSMGFSVSDESGAFEYGGASPNALYATRRNIADLRFHGMVRDLVRFNREAKRLVREDELAEDLSLRDFLREGGYGRMFEERLIVPQVSAVWSADPDQLWDFPARFIFKFFDNHGVLGFRGRPQWRTISGGSIEYVKRLSAPFKDRIRTGAPVERVVRDAGGVDVTAAGRTDRYDEVVIAAHSDQALAILTDASRSEQEILGAIPYVPNEAVLHTDISLMPRRRAAWASWNYHLLDVPKNRTTVTYWMNELQNIPGPTEYLVSLNVGERVDPDHVIARFDYAHPVYTPEGVTAQDRHDEISGVNRTHYCGAYWRWGFHEDGVWSAVRVAERLGGKL
jgi:predicted NAD/FAD-binding protein